MRNPTRHVLTALPRTCQLWPYHQAFSWGPEPRLDNSTSTVNHRIIGSRGARAGMRAGHHSAHNSLYRSTTASRNPLAQFALTVQLWTAALSRPHCGLRVPSQ